MKERTERMIDILEDEWDEVIVLCSMYDGEKTTCFRKISGNSFAVRQMLRDTLDEYEFGGPDNDEDEKEATDC